MTDYANELDERRTHLRRRAIEEDWPAKRLALAEDLADTANDDGTRALRSIEAQVRRLGIPERTVRRHRDALRDGGVLIERSRGGNGRGASIFDLAPVSHRPPTGGDMDANPSSESPVTRQGADGRLVASSRPVTGQSPATPQAERGRVLLPSSPASQQPRSPRSEADELASAYGTSAEVAAAMIALAEADPKVTHAVGLLRHTEYESNERFRVQAEQQVAERNREAQAAAQRAELEAAAGMPALERGHEHYSHWATFAAAYRRRESAPQRYAEALADLRALSEQAR